MTRSRRPVAVAAGLVLAVTALAGCGDVAAHHGASGPGASGTGASVTGEDGSVADPTAVASLSVLTNQADQLGDQVDQQLAGDDSAASG